MPAMPRLVRRFSSLALAAVTATAAATVVSISTDSVPTAQADPCQGLGDGSVGTMGTPGELVMGGVYRAASQAGILNNVADAIVGNSIPWFNTLGGHMPKLTGRTDSVELVTGRTSPNKTADRFGITGTDLGIMWDNGNREVLMAVGDTMGNCIGDSQWRSNVLFRSKDGILEDGMNLDNAPMEAPGLAKSIIPRSGIPGAERTVIPTAGISVAGKQYLRYMSVIDWGRPGHWETNYSSLAVSGDNGENWNQLPWTWRVTGQNRLPVGPANFFQHDVEVQQPGQDAPRKERRNDPPPRMDNGQMSAFVKDGDFAYEFLTPSGRQGDARVGRVRIRNEQGQEYWQDFENPTKYEYWDAGKREWTGDFNRATPVIPAPVSELSVAYNEYLGRYIALYTNGDNNIVMRQADSPVGPWSGEDVLLSDKSLPSIYGAYVHPWSLNGRDMYFTVSTWDAYNVFLMKTNLDYVRRSEITPENRPDPETTGEVQELSRTPIPGF